jgi:hypothetical protein
MDGFGSRAVRFRRHSFVVGRDVNLYDCQKPVSLRRERQHGQWYNASSSHSAAR